MKKILIITSICLLFGYACKSKKTASAESPVEVIISMDCNPSITYTNDVKGIIDAQCASSCHSQYKKAGGYDLSTFEQLTTSAVQKRLLGAIKHKENFSAMPMKNPKLSDSSIQIIECWIQNGMMR